MAAGGGGVFLRRPDGTQQACAYGRSVFDELAELGGTVQRGPHYEFTHVYFQKLDDVGDVAVALGPCAAESRESRVRLGRAAESLPGTAPQWGVSVTCPARELQLRGVQLPPRFAAPRVAVVVVVRDSSGRVLLTRRTPHMRTFPKCWVFPGGAVDAGETLQQAAAREVLEETGLSVSAEDMRPLCLWESVYPTSAEECERRGQVGGHALVLFLTADAPSGAEAAVRLQRAECDRCVWAPLDALSRLHRGQHGGESGSDLPGWRAEAGDAAGGHSELVGIAPERIALTQLHGIYPNSEGEGIGQGHLFALGVLLDPAAPDSPGAAAL